VEQFVWWKSWKLFEFRISSKADECLFWGTYTFPSWCWQPILILVNWNPCSTWFHFEFSFHSAPSCILIAFAYCTDHKCIKPGQNSQLMLPHIRIPIRIRTHIRRLVMAIVYCLFIALLINCRLYLCQFFRPIRPLHLFPCQFLCTCPFFMDDLRPGKQHMQIGTVS